MSRFVLNYTILNTSSPIFDKGKPSSEIFEILFHPDFIEAGLWILIVILGVGIFYTARSAYKQSTGIHLPPFQSLLISLDI